MTRGALARAAIVAGTMATGAIALAAGSAQVFRTDIDTVFLSVTVTDGRNHAITDLTREEFRIFEDGAVQDISVFTKEPQPIALSILIDSSTSMEEKITMAQQGATGFVHRLGARDVAQVIDFNNTTEIRQPFTSDPQALEDAIRSIRTGGSTSLYNTIYIALSELQRARMEAAGQIRRQAMVLLSDGEDTTSRKTYDDVAEMAKRSDVAIYAIGLRTRDSSVDRRFNQADFALRTLSQFTGGRVFFVDDVKQLPAVYTQIADELANQYFIGYNTKNTKRDGAWRQIALRVARPETVVRTKTGYFGPTKAP